MTNPITPQPSTLRERIERALDNSILDWNRPSQLTSIDAKDNYDKLTPLIEQLVRDEVRKELQYLRRMRDMNGTHYFRADKIDERLEALQPAAAKTCTECPRPVSRPMVGKCDFHAKGGDR